jgi:hypothetical protein
MKRLDRLRSNVVEAIEIIRNDRRGAGWFRAGCNTCGWRRDYISREYAERGIHEHVRQRGPNGFPRCRTEIYVPTWRARFRDWLWDHRDYA